MSSWKFHFGPLYFGFITVVTFIAQKLYRNPSDAMRRENDEPCISDDELKWNDSEDRRIKKSFSAVALHPTVTYEKELDIRLTNVSQTIRFE